MGRLNAHQKMDNVQHNVGALKLYTYKYRVIKTTLYLSTPGISGAEFSQQEYVCFSKNCCDWCTVWVTRQHIPWCSSNLHICHLDLHYKSPTIIQHTIIKWNQSMIVYFQFNTCCKLFCEYNKDTDALW